VIAIYIKFKNFVHLLMISDDPVSSSDACQGL